MIAVAEEWLSNKPLLAEQHTECTLRTFLSTLPPHLGLSLFVPARTSHAIDRAGRTHTVGDGPVETMSTIGLRMSTRWLNLRVYLFRAFGNTDHNCYRSPVFPWTTLVGWITRTETVVLTATRGNIVEVPAAERGFKRQRLVQCYDELLVFT